MPRTIDLIRASKLPSNMMQFAAKGALSVPAGRKYRNPGVSGQAQQDF